MILQNGEWVHTIDLKKTRTTVMQRPLIYSKPSSRTFFFYTACIQVFNFFFTFQASTLPPPPSFFNPRYSASGDTGMKERRSFRSVNPIHMLLFTSGKIPFRWKVFRPCCHKPHVWEIALGQEPLLEYGVGYWFNMKGQGVAAYIKNKRSIFTKE